MILDQLLAGARERVAALRPRLAEVRKRAASVPAARPFAAALRRGEGPLRVIAEIKRKSPSGGNLRPLLAPVALARSFARAGAAALSVLTEPGAFAGTLGDLSAARVRCALPILRKDFTVDPAQVWEARAAGADAVLLIVRALPGAALGECLAAAKEAGLSALVEADNEQDLAAALQAKAEVIGVNARDLDTLRVDAERARRIVASVPAGPVVVAESGIKGPADVAPLVGGRADAVLVGEALMKADDPAAALRDLRAALGDGRAGAPAA
ncbi:MAG: indole-3-glycerol phosphate synthase TrpC, partial [Planctomycetales bacterium]|nr:indole-3-glycerol phosphate synthase TrpC [Planctomycetales bacterium]